TSIACARSRPTGCGRWGSPTRSSRAATPSLRDGLRECSGRTFDGPRQRGRAGNRTTVVAGTGGPQPGQSAAPGGAGSMTTGDGATRHGVRGAIRALSTTPDAGTPTGLEDRAAAAAEIAAAHRAELARDACRLVRSAGVAEADRALAAAVVAGVQEAVLGGAARSGVPLDARTWAPLV